MLSFLSLLSVCAIPYIAFPVCYQAFKLRVWCPFCLCVIAILFIGNLVFFFNPGIIF